MNKQELQSYIYSNTDKYFSNTKKTIENNKDNIVVYGFFVRKPSVYACKLALDFLKSVAITMNTKINIYELFKEGDLVPAGEPLFYVEGSYVFLSELETLLLQKVGLPVLCAWNAYMMCRTLANSSFISMIARHCANPSMVYAADYGASVGSSAAKKLGALGFIGASTDASAELFNTTVGLGTMPHALIGYAGSTKNAAIMFYEAMKPNKLTVLVDYFGKEVTDTLEVCNHFSSMAYEGNFSIRLDTHGGRFLEGLDSHKSQEIMQNVAPQTFVEYKNLEDLNYLIGTGVSAASIFYMRQVLNENGFNKVKIVVSSGFSLKKCVVMSDVKAPIDSVGTGSFMPELWSDTYATSDIVSYDGRLSVKQGREFLLGRWCKVKEKQVTENAK